jgi:ankyrin repeat protein
MLKKITVFFCFVLFSLPLSAQFSADPELIAAIEADDLKKVKALVKAGADVNLAATLYTANYTYFISREALHTRIVPPGENKMVYVSPLIVACSRKNLDMVKFLMKKKANSDAADSDGKTPLMYALRESGGEEVALYLLKKGANYVVEDYAGNTALHYAAYGGNEQGIRMALGGGLNVNHKNKEGITPFLVAAHHANSQVLELLKSMEADVAAKDSAGMNAVFYAAANGNMDNLRLLTVEYLLPGYSLSSEQYSPMDIAALAGHPEVSSVLQNSYFFYKYAELEKAVKANDLLVVDKLLKEGANPEHYEVPEPLLHYAARNGFVGIAELLFRKTKTESPKNAKGQTPFQVALEASQYRMATVLYKYPIEVQEQDIALVVSRLHSQQPPSDMESYYELLSKLIESAAYINVPYGSDNNTALHFAMLAANKRVAEMLLEKNADVNKVNANGWTPLHYAVTDYGGTGLESLRLELTKLLIAKGANVQALTTKQFPLPFRTNEQAYVPAGCNSLDILSFMGGSFPPIQKELEKAGLKPVAKSPQWTDAGLYYRTTINKNKALWAFNNALALDMKYSEAWLQLGELQRELDKPKEGAKAFGEYVKLMPNDAAGWKGRAACRFESGDYSNAKEDFNKAISLNPAEASYYYFRGQTFLKLKQKENACADFTKGGEMGDTRCTNSWTIHCK